MSALALMAAEPPSTARLLTLEEAAGILRVSTKTLTRQWAKGQLKLVQIGRRKLCPRAEVERLMSGDAIAVRE
jgi:excisionase family DNA binding protein